MSRNEAQDFLILKSGMENLQVLLPVYRDFLTYYQERYGHLLRNIPLTPSGIREYLREQFERAEAVVFVAVIDSAPGDAAGFTLLCKDLSGLKEAETWQIKDLFVAPAQRGSGLGTRLVQTACRYCESEQAKSVTLLTGKINREARALYEKYGFVLDPSYIDLQNLRYIWRKS